MFSIYRKGAGCWTFVVRTDDDEAINRLAESEKGAHFARTQGIWPATVAAGSTMIPQMFPWMTATEAAS